MTLTSGLGSSGKTPASCSHTYRPYPRHALSPENGALDATAALFISLPPTPKNNCISSYMCPQRKKSRPRQSQRSHHRGRKVRLADQHGCFIWHSVGVLRRLIVHDQKERKNNKQNRNQHAQGGTRWSVQPGKSSTTHIPHHTVPQRRQGRLCLLKTVRAPNTHPPPIHHPSIPRLLNPHHRAGNIQNGDPDGGSTTPPK